MSRIVSVWLPRWPILRFLAAQERAPSRTPVDSERPFVLAADASGGPRIAALNAAASAEGLAVGDTVADARVKADRLQVRDADPVADANALRRLALWATRYTPTVSAWDDDSGADGLFLDVTGATHLFGGEEKLLADFSNRLRRFGWPARLAVADTAGTAWALARFRPQTPVMLPSGQEAAALAPLPIEALRLPRNLCTMLRRLGFKRVGALFGAPRAPFAARFERVLLQNLDRALGHAAEPLPPVASPPIYYSLRYLLEPIASQPAIVAVAARLMRDIVHALVRDGVGARALRLTLYRVDGATPVLDLGLALPTRNAEHVERLIVLQLDRLTGPIDVGFGFEALGLAVTSAEPMPSRQMDLAGGGVADPAERSAALIDGLRQRLGPQSVRQLKPFASHLPERAEMACLAPDVPAWPQPDPARTRPLLLLPHAEPAKVMALVPDGPPKRFCWRGAVHRVVRAQGPERIAAEWWRHSTPQPTRDYFLVEDEEGCRFWLYRDGLYERETKEPGWFVHGLFA